MKPIAPRSSPLLRRPEKAQKKGAVAKPAELAPATFEGGFTSVEGTAASTRAVLTNDQAQAFMGRVITAKNRFYQDQVGYDDKTGLTYDGHPIDFHTGALIGGPNTFSASSKESLLWYRLLGRPVSESAPYVAGTVPLVYWDGPRESLRLVMLLWFFDRPGMNGNLGGIRTHRYFPSSAANGA